MGYFVAPRYATGPGAIEQLSSLGAATPVLLVAARLADHERVRRVEEELAKAGATPARVPIPPGGSDGERADGIAAALGGIGPDLLVAVGGGRTIDLARAGWVRWARPELPLEGISPLVELGLRAKAGLVAIPATAGAGAEGSPTLRLHDAAGEPFRPTSRELLPDWVLLDPELPRSAPAGPRSDAFAIAVAHALEALVSAWGGAFSEALARRALALLTRHAPRPGGPPDPEIAELLAEAAALAGLSAGTAQDGAAAALAEALEGAGPASYGRRVGILLPYLLEFNYPSARDVYQTVSAEVGAPIAHRSDLPARIRTLLSSAGLPTTLRDAGYSEERLREFLPTIVRRAGRSPDALSNPRLPSDEEWGRLVHAAFRGDAVGF